MAGVRRTPLPLALRANAGHWFDALSAGKEAGMQAVNSFRCDEDRCLD